MAAAEQKERVRRILLDDLEKREALVALQEYLENGLDMIDAILMGDYGQAKIRSYPENEE